MSDVAVKPKSPNNAVEKPEESSADDFKSEEENVEEPIEEKIEELSEQEESPVKKIKAVKSGDDSEDDDEEPPLGLLERPVIIESGKRERKKVERLAMSQAYTPTEKKLDVPEGSGLKLGEIPRVEFFLNKAHSEDMKILHRLLYGRPGAISMVKRNIRKFCGFTFVKGSAEWEKKHAVVNRCTSAQLKMVCEVLDLERSGKKEDLVNKVMEFLLSPKESGKPLPKSKRSKKKGDKGKQKNKADGKKSKKKKQSPKKKAGASSADEELSDGEEDENDDDDDDDIKSVDEEGDDNEADNTKEESESEGEQSDKESEKSESEPESEEEEKPKKKKTKAEKPAKKASPKKEKKKPAKQKPEKKATPKKRKKAQSDSDEESDEDAPLSKKKKGPPTDDEIKDVVKKILEGANLEEVTMKTVCRQVYDRYPDFDLTDRKDFIKSSVKQLIS